MEELLIDGKSSGSTEFLDKENMFDAPCDCLQSASFMLDNSVKELLNFKEDLLKTFLPSSLLIKFLLLLSNLLRCMVTMKGPQEELIRLVKLHSSSWETKSKIFKKQQNDLAIKQRQLDIALRQLEMSQAKTRQTEQGRRLMNWQKLFLKVAYGDNSTIKWRFAIGSLKKRIQNGMDVNDLYCNPSLQKPHKSAAERPDLAKRISTLEKVSSHSKIAHTESTPNASRKTPNSNTCIKSSTSNSSETATLDLIPSTEEMRQEMKSKATKAVRFCEENSIQFGASCNAVTSNKLSQNVVKSSVESEDMVCQQQTDGPQSKSAVLEKIASEKATWTHEPFAENLLVIQLFPLKDTGIKDEVYYLGTFNGQLQKTGSLVVPFHATTQVPGDEKIPDAFQEERNLSTEETPERFHELQFPLDEEKLIQGQTIKLGVYLCGTKQLVAMTTIVLDESLPVIVKHDNDGDRRTELHPQLQSKCVLHTLRSVQQDNDQLPFNSTCGQLPAVVFKKKFIITRTRDKGVPSSKQHFLLDASTQTKALAFVKTKSTQTKFVIAVPSDSDDSDQDKFNSPPNDSVENYYTLNDAENPERYRETYSKDCAVVQYAKRNDVGMSNDICSLYDRPVAEISTKAVEVEQHSNLKQRPKTTPSQLPKWGSGLPSDFFQRMQTFQQASEDRLQELREKVKGDEEQTIVKRLSSSRLLHRQHADRSGRSLPAVFMPLKAKKNPEKKSDIYKGIVLTYHNGGSFRSSNT